MAPGGGGKRKRGDRTFSQDSRDESSRPSPHRPGDLSLGQHINQQHGQQSQNHGRDQYDLRGGGRRRGGRGGRGGGSQRNSMDSPNAIPPQSRYNTSSSNRMSPPVPPAPPVMESKANIAARPIPPPETAATQIAEQKPTNSARYAYEYISEERMKAWGENGREAVIMDGVKAREVEDSLVLGVLFQELIKCTLDGHLAASDAGLTIKEILARDVAAGASSDVVQAEAAFDASSVFLDSLSIVAEFASTASTLHPLVTATGISPLQMRRELDSTLLENLGLVRKNIFVRVGIRQQTNLLYRQSNYNLLREETEGYSKLVTDLFTTSINEPPTSVVVEETFERVKGMIGAFDMDVGRVLDITLDVFAAVLIKHYRFVVKYLRGSSWWPHESSWKNSSGTSSFGPLPRWALPGSSGRALSDGEKEKVATARTQRNSVFWQRAKEHGMAAFFEIGGRQTDQSALNTAINKGGGSETSQHEEDRKWIEYTGTLPPPGNKVAAQVLGFKLRFYSSTARDPTDVLPINLIYLTALLIKVGFISLRDLYPHIWPADEAMENVRKEKLNEKAEKEKLNRPGGGVPNALLAAAPLPDDTIEGQSREAARLREAEAARRHSLRADVAADRSTPSAQPEEKAGELPEPFDQKVQLLKSLLCIGALPEALYMLGRFPWLLEVFPDLPEYIHRILHHCLDDVYEPLRPLKDDTNLRQQQQIPDSDQSGLAKGQIRLVDAPARRTLRWAQLDKDDITEGTDYRFYWDDWADIIPVCQTVDDVFTLCSTLLNYSGVKIGQDTSLLLKLARIGNHSIAVDPSPSNMARWVDLSKRLIVPALSFTKCNPGVVNEVFELIKNFSTPTRYSIYAEWYSGQISRQPDMKSAFEQAKAETKDVLKRISKTTIKPMARALAKVAYASPGIVFSVAIAQLESYENIVDAVVECARYFTYLAYDVLTWSLMSALGGQGRNRVQADGMLTSKWLAALSLFAGKVFKRYSVMNPTPIVQYVAEQLRQSNSTDLIVLEEITKSMAGIVSDSTFNEAQVLSMGGGDLLQAQTMLQLLDRRHESKITARRLMKSLTDSKLAGQVLVSVAQERQTCIFKIEEVNAHPKLLGNLFDQLHRILIQYTELLRSNLSIKDFNYFVPEISRLVAEFGIEPSIAFWISRPSINAAMAEHDAKFGKLTIDAKKSPGKDAAKSTLNSEKDPSEKVANTKEVSVVNDGEMDVSVSAIAEIPKGEGDDVVLQITQDNEHAESSAIDAKAENLLVPWHPILKEIMEAIRPTLPEATWEYMSPSFYVTFWQCSLRDMLVPLQSYDDENHRQQKKIDAINSDRSDISIIGTQKKDREKKILTDLQFRLREECKDHIQTYQQTRMRLQKEKDQWFAGFRGKWDALNVALIEQCFFPRILLSPVDAMYTFKMLKYLHSSGTANFRTMGVYDQLFRDQRLTSMLFLCTAKEAECFGRFLNEVLRDLSRWHADKSFFEKEAFGPKKDLPGFSKKISDDNAIVSFWDYEDFRRILLKWHRNLNIALKACLSSGEYMHIRNAINILNNIHHYFPAVNWMGQSQLNCITELIKNETREDLKIAASSLLGALKRREKHWVMPQAFNLVENGTSGGNAARSGSAKPGTPRPEGDTKPLNTKAPDFQPNPQPIANENTKIAKTASGRLDAEDGEIEDVHMSDSRGKENADSDILQIENPPEDTSRNPISESTSPAISSEVLTAGEEVEPSTSSANQALKASEASAEAAPLPQKQDARPLSNVASPHPSVPARPEAGRGQRAGNGPVQHNLPTRPEAPQSRVGDHRLPGRPNDRAPHDHPRDSRFQERRPVERPRDMLRERAPERPGSGPHFAGPERADGRPYGSDKDRLDSRPKPDLVVIEDRQGLPSVDSLFQNRDDRAGRGSNAGPSFEQSKRDAMAGEHYARGVGMPPPRSIIPQHPDRAAMIHGNQDQNRSQPANYPSDRRSEIPRYSSHPNSERGSRGSSPARIDDRRILHDSRRDGRTQHDGRRYIEDMSRPPPSRYEDPHAPTGPRTDRPPTDGPMTANDRFRDSKKPLPSVGSTFDPNHGRLKQDSTHSGRQTESQYGRLNTGNDVPSGPRLQNGHQPPSTRGSRNVSAPQPQPDHQQLPLSSQSVVTPPMAQDRQTPSGPSGRGPSRNAGSTPSVHPTQPAEGTEIVGIHPDRLKAIQGTGPPPTANATQNRGEANRGSRQAPPPVSVPSPAPPRGPNNHLQSPIQQSPTNRGPPTGPSIPNDRNRDKRFAGIQNVLQQANSPNAPERSGQGASIRGRGGRVNNGNMQPPTSGPLTPNLLNQDPLSNRGDLLTTRSNRPVTSQHNDEDASYGRGDRRGAPPREAPRGEERRSGRNRSRSPGKDRPSDGPMVVREDDRQPGRADPRERFRSEMQPNIRGGGGGERDMRSTVGPRRSGRGDVTHRSEPERRDGHEWNGDSNGGYDRRGDERERRDGGGSGRKRGRGEEGAGERPMDSKRTRR